MGRILIDEDSFESKGINGVSEGLRIACEQLVGQLRVHSAIDNIAFKHEEIGEDITVYIRRQGDDFLVSLEGKDFTIKD